MKGDSTALSDTDADGRFRRQSRDMLTLQLQHVANVQPLQSTSLLPIGTPPQSATYPPQGGRQTSPQSPLKSWHPRAGISTLPSIQPSSTFLLSPCFGEPSRRRMAIPLSQGAFHCRTSHVAPRALQCRSGRRAPPQGRTNFLLRH